LSDSNLQFNVGETIIEKPSQLTAKAKYFKSRDHMAIIEGEEEAKEIKQKETTIAQEEKVEVKKPAVEEEIVAETVTADEVDSFLQYDKKAKEPTAKHQEELHTISQEIEI